MPSRRTAAAAADTPSEAGTGTLTDALTRIMGAIGRIEKAGTAPPAMGAFKFVRETDVVEALQAQLVTERIMLLPRVTLLDTKEASTSSGKKQWLPIVQLDLYARRGEEELLLATTVGQGQDTSDKGISKATTSAKKQALLIAFMVPTGDDPEAVAHEDSVSQAQPRQQARRQAAQAQQAPVAQPADSGGSVASRPQITRQDLAQRVSQLIRQVNGLPPEGQKIVNGHSIRNHLAKEEIGGWDGVGSLLQKGTGQQIMDFVRYLQGKLEEASQATPAELAPPPAGRAEDMSDEDAMAAGAALLGDQS